jgi:radical SAM protein with 4Fe4S-binding SPASM domain
MNRLNTVDRYIATTNSDCDCANDCDCACLSLNNKNLKSYYLEITSECNNSCLGCGNVFLDTAFPRQTENSQSFISGKMVKKIISSVLPTARKINITGGEPTLHPDFFEILEFIADTKTPFSIFTNGRWDNTSKLLDFLKPVSSFTGFLVSLHGPNKESHSFFSGMGSEFDIVVKNIQIARSIGLPVSISTVITKQNWDQIDQMVALLSQFDLNQLVFNRHISTFGKPLSDVGPTLRQLKSSIKKIERLKKMGTKVKFGPCIPICYTNSSSNRCGAGMSFLTIDPWGNVRPCNHTSHVIGNLFKNTIDEIWNSTTLDLWRGYVPPACRGCPEYSFCGGGCQALAIDSIDGNDPLVIKKNVKTAIEINTFSAFSTNGA